jgi:homoserine kinase type II
MAVYTEVTDEEAARFLSDYDIGEVTSLKGIAEGVENSNFLLRTTMGTYILTLYEKRVNPDDLPFFLGLMDHLSAKGITCPTPLHTKDGAALSTLCGRPAAITSFLDGLGPKRVMPIHCRELGTALAKMHIAGNGFELTRPNALSLPSWRPLFEKCQNSADDVHPGLARDILSHLDALEAAWPTALPSGVIHADLFTDNVFFMPGPRLSGLIDFYFACNDFFAYDLAICINAWCFEPDGAFNITKARQLLSGYQSQRPLSDAELAALPTLARGSAMRFLLTRLYDWINTPADALVVRKDPMEYLRKLRFHGNCSDASAYGL